MKKILLLMAMFVNFYGIAQNTNEAVYLSQPDKEAIDSAIKNAESSQLYHFALTENVSYTMSNCGFWEESENGGRTWKGHFISPGARNVSFMLKGLVLPKGAFIRAYPDGDPRSADVYDSQNLSASPYLGIWPVYGDDVWLEYYEPADVRGQGNFQIFRVGIGYKDVYTKSASNIPAPPPSLECNFDVECFMEGIETLKNHNKKSVALILGNTGDGVFLASGALVNNTANDGKPYVLSANHAWVDGAVYAFRFNWRDPDPDCPSSGWGDQGINSNNSITGATLRARRAQSDFMLLEIDSALPEDWDLVWSGWDRNGIPCEYTYGIHHPAGDIMKICRDYDSPEILDEDNGDLKWLINHWEIGTTEGGSSGSPLLTEQGRIIGQLWAGASGCIGSEPNAAGDVYGRFDVSWDAGDTPDTRLKEWLDPGETGEFTIDFYPPLPVYELDGLVKFIEEGSNFCGTEAVSIIHFINNGTTPITSAVFEYTMNDNEPQTITWEGTLEPNEATVINLPAVAGGEGENIFTITLANVNGIADDNPDNDSVTANFVKRVYQTNEIVLQLLTDNYGEDISWELVNDNGVVVESGGSYNSSLYTSETFEVPNGCYLFTITDSYGDGICCEHGLGMYSLLAGDEIIATGGDFNSVEKVNFMLDGELSIDNKAKDAFSVYPNPTRDILTVSGDIEGSSYKIFSILGQELASGTFIQGRGTVDISELANGVYLLRLTDVLGNVTDKRIIKE